MKVLAVMTYFQISLPTHNWDSAFYMGPFFYEPTFHGLMDSWGQSVRQSGSNTYSPASQRRISFTQA